jgi:hypothetical protein
MSGANEDDAKHVAQVWRKKPATERILKQWLSLESVNANSKTFRAHYDVAMRGSAPLIKVLHCDCCAFVAGTIAEVIWHERHNPGHEIL